MSILLPAQFYGFFPRPQVGLFDVIAFFKGIMKKSDKYAASLTTTSHASDQKTKSDEGLPSALPNFSPEEEKFITHNLDSLEKAWLEKKKSIEKKRELAEEYGMRSGFEHDCTQLFEKIRTKNNKDGQALDFLTVDKKILLQNVYKNMLQFLLTVKDNPKTNKQHRENAQKAYAILISDNPDAEKIEELIRTINWDNYTIKDETLPKVVINSYLGIVNYRIVGDKFYTDAFTPLYLESKFLDYCHQQRVFAFVKDQKIKKEEIRPDDTISLTTTSRAETVKSDSGLPSNLPNNFSPEEEKFVTHNLDLLEKAWLEKKKSIERKREVAEKYDVRSSFEHDCTELFNKTLTGEDENVTDFLGKYKKEFLRNFYNDMLNFLRSIKDYPETNRQHRENAQKAYAILMSDNPDAEEIYNLILKIEKDNYKIKDTTIPDYPSEPYSTYVDRHINYFKFLEYCHEQGIFGFVKNQKIKKGEIRPNK